MEQIINLSEINWNTTSRKATFVKILVWVINKNLFDKIEKDWNKWKMESYMGEFYRYYKENESILKSTSFEDHLTILEKNLDKVNKNNYFKLKEHNLHGVLIEDFDNDFRWDITNIIDLLDGNFVIKTINKWGVQFYWYSNNNSWKKANYVFYRVQDVIAYLYSDYYSAIIRLYNEEDGNVK